MTQTEQVQVTDGMIIEWDVPIDMDDGVQPAGSLHRSRRTDRASRLTMGTTTDERNKAFVPEAFDTLANRRDFVAARQFWSADYIQHSADIPPGRDGLFNLVKASSPDRRYENALAVADGDYVMLHGRLSTTGPQANRIAGDIVRLEDGLIAEHWDVLQDEATGQESKSRLPMFGDTFPTRA